MRLSEYTDCTPRALMCCARHGERLLTVGERAGQRGRSRGHLMKGVNDLARQGLIEPTRGPGSGVRLSKEPGTIRIGAALRGTFEALDGASWADLTSGPPGPEQPADGSPSPAGRPWPCACRSPRDRGRKRRRLRGAVAHGKFTMTLAFPGQSAPVAGFEAPLEGPAAWQLRVQDPCPTLLRAQDDVSSFAQRYKRHIAREGSELPPMAEPVGQRRSRSQRPGHACAASRRGRFSPSCSLDVRPR